MSNEDLSKQLGDLRVRLFKNKVSQKRLAKQCKISPAYLNNLLTGNIRSVSFEKFNQIKEAAEALIYERQTTGGKHGSEN